MHVHLVPVRTYLRVMESAANNGRHLETGCSQQAPPRL